MVYDRANDRALPRKPKIGTARAAPLSKERGGCAVRARADQIETDFNPKTRNFDQ